METIEVDGLGELEDAAERIIERLEAAGVVAFYGSMGAGKTTLISEICRQLGVEDNVVSPTFALVNHYRNAREEDIFHFDFYRIDRIEEAFDMGYEEYFYSGSLCFVEWPEKIYPLLPDDTLKVEIEIIDEHKRKIIIK